ncbi:hypothetical protein [Myxococcus fulvus]|uniref:hypothetical protein n=1 Tax=Myxococcus fulvus TaxID=33 RepID=UPI0020C079A9|nr:hypothetical protein [Myxococcus fulvus]MCK8504219.1 hypothetical protein [Myxococcus fulvus]
MSLFAGVCGSRGVLMAWANTSFNVQRQSDHHAISAFLKVFADSEVVRSGIKVRAAEASLDIGPGISPKSEGEEDLRRILKLLPDDSMSIVNLALHCLYGDRGFVVKLQRNGNGAADIINLELNGLGGAGEGKEVVAAMIHLVAVLKRHLKALDARDGIASIVGKETKRFLERREVELLKVEELGRTLVAQLAESTATVRVQLEEEYRLRRLAVETEGTTEKQRLLAVIQEREKHLELREKEVDRRIAEIDDRDSRHVRRDIRREQKRELQASAEKFGLTNGTQELRNPVRNASYLLIIVLLLLVVASTVFNFMLLVDDAELSTIAWAFLGAKQSILTAGLVSAVVFHIRWSNRWFEQHASEEFRLKRLGLDLDRASWLVETALEWKEIKGTETPIALIDRLSAGLFVPDVPKQDQTAVDRLAAALLGASAEVTLPIPGGGTARLDRKGIEAMRKASESD